MKFIVNELFILCLSTLGFSQGLDEAPVKTCSPDKFSCDGSTRCVPTIWLCDGSPDCVDKTDELEKNCLQGVTMNPSSCRADKFQCGNGICLPLRWKCDGHDDCGDGTDEDDEVCGTDVKCEENEFKCGDNQCISNIWHCDGHIDCNDGTDEDNCPKITAKTNDSKSTKFQCLSGYRIPSSWICDGAEDCDSGEDEKNCEDADSTNNPDILNSTAKKCRSSEFRCPDSMCILASWVCDGKEDCLGGRDEVNCSLIHCEEETEFSCADKKHCIDKRLICDGIHHCDDRSDELDCNHDVTTIKADIEAKGNEPDVEIKSNKAESVTEQPKFIEQTTASSCDLHTEFRCHSGKCIPKSQLCDQHTNCPHREDESRDLCGINECDRNNGGCQHKCIDTREGYECQCSKGYKLAGKYACVDIDECVENPGICSQNCNNTRGSFHCSCQEGYMREPSNYTRCKASTGEVYLLFSHSYDIRSLRLRDSDMKFVVQGTRRAIALDYSYEEGKILWSDKKDKKIYRARLENTTDREVLVNDEEISADGLAVDWIHNNIYYTDTVRSSIRLLSWDAQYVKTIVTEEIGHPRAIVVSPHNGYIYWTDWGSNAKIERASLNGADRTAIVSHPNVVWPNGLVIDHSTEKIYWCDGRLRTISSSNLDGSNIEVILYSPIYLRQPFSISVFEDRLYWTDWSQLALFSANKFTGYNIQNLTAGHMLESPKVVHVYHQYRQPRSENVCENHPCSQFCLRSPLGELFCDCEDEYVLKKDQLTCIRKDLLLLEEQDASTTTQILQVTELKLIHDQDVFENPESRVGFIIGIIVGISCGVAIILGVYIAWTKKNTKPVQRIRFHNSVYRKTTCDELDGRGYVTDQDQLFSSHPTRLSQIDQHLTEADDAPLTTNEEYDRYAV